MCLIAINGPQFGIGLYNIAVRILTRSLAFATDCIRFFLSIFLCGHAI